MTLPDFDAAYRGETETLPGSREVPWNIGEPQPALEEILAAGVSSPVLDAGCGVGVTSIRLSRAGYEVVGVDAAAPAIDEARRAAAEAGVDAVFAVDDLTELSGYDGYFATVVDSAVLHAMPPDAQPDYLRAIARAARPGAVLHVLVFSDAVGGTAVESTTAVSEDRLRELVGAHWTVDEVTPSVILARVPDDASPKVPRDAQGRARFPAWRLRAHLPA